MSQAPPFEYTLNQQSLLWSFSLQDDQDSRKDYLAVPEAQRSLSHLLKDLDHQLSLRQHNNTTITPYRAIRKCTKRLLKDQHIALATLSQQISESTDALRSYFRKEQLEAEDSDRISTKCKEWLEQKLNALTHEEVLALSKGFVARYFKESQEQRHDHKFVDDVYLIYMLDKFTPHSKELKTESKSLVEIDLNLSVEDRAITDSFLWDSSRTHQLDIWMYTRYLVSDLLLEYDISASKEQFQALHQQTRIQLRTQLQYKTMLNRYKPLLVNFSTMELNNEVKEYVIPVEIRVMDNSQNLIYSDDLEWDILNESNNIEQFCQILIQDEGIPREFLSEISEQIRSQIYNELNWKFTCLSNTFKTLLKEKELPKLKNQATGQIKKNIIYTLDVQLPLNPEGYTQSSNLEFHNSQMFSIISRNLDLLPSEYQSKVSFNEAKKEKEVNPKITLDKLNSFVSKNNLKIENNPYLPASLTSQFDPNRLRSLYSNVTTNLKEK